MTEGTAAGTGLGPGVYGKTRTADDQGQDQGQDQPNARMVTFGPDQDVAVAVLVDNAGYGAQVAGSEVKTLLGGY